MLIRFFWSPVLRCLGQDIKPNKMVYTWARCLCWLLWDWSRQRFQGRVKISGPSHQICTSGLSNFYDLHTGKLDLLTHQQHSTPNSGKSLITLLKWKSFTQNLSYISFLCTRLREDTSDFNLYVILFLTLDIYISTPAYISSLYQQRCWQTKCESQIILVKHNSNVHCGNFHLETQIFWNLPCNRTPKVPTFCLQVCPIKQTYGYRYQSLKYKLIYSYQLGRHTQCFHCFFSPKKSPQVLNCNAGIWESESPLHVLSQMLWALNEKSLNKNTDTLFLVAKRYSSRSSKSSTPYKRVVGWPTK